MVEQEVKSLNKSFYSAWWVSRVSTIVMLAVTCVALSQAALLLWLFPLKEVKHVLLTAYNKDTQVIEIKPIGNNSKGQHKLMELYSKQFIVDLHTVDGQTEAIRYKKLITMTEEDVKDYVVKTLDMENQNATAKKLIADGITRSVVIRDCQDLSPEAPNTFRISWKLLELEKDTHVQKRTYFVSLVKAKSKVKTLSVEEEDLNPIGYTVIGYSIKAGTND